MGIKAGQVRYVFTPLPGKPQKTKEMKTVVAGPGVEPGSVGYEPTELPSFPSCCELRGSCAAQWFPV